MFRDMLCQRTNALLNCDNIQYEVVRMGSFSDFASFPATFDDDGNLLAQGFDPGGVDDVILIRTVYRYPMLTPLVGRLLADGPNNSKLLVSTVVLETEPYDVEQVVNDL
jgi:hypothetical protein